MGALLLAAGLLMALTQEPAPATRAAEATAQREAKSRDLKPHQRSGVERLLFRIEDSLLLERWLNPPRGVYLRVGGIGEGAGFGLGPGYRYSTSQFDFRISAAASMKRYAIAESSLLLPGVVRNGPFAEVYARRRDFPQEDFYGIGPRTRPEDRSNFALRDTLIRAGAGLRAGAFAAGIRAGYLQPSIGRGTDKRVPSTDLSSGIAGLGEQPSFTILEPFVEVGGADPPGNPTKGARLRASWARYSDRDFDRHSFDRFDVDARAYIPFFHRTRTIALRTWVSESRPETGHEVPFYLQPTLGGSYSLRGFRTFRFRDRAVALFQAEYRWRINELVSGALFYDTGAVARTLQDLGRLERDYGFGLRAGGRAGVAFRTDIVFGSGEGTRILVRFDNVF